VSRGWLAHLDVEDRDRSEMLDPRVPLNVRTPRIAASKSDSACTSTVCRMPRTSANETAQIRSGTG
jgi:hypothetical protein